MKKWVCQVCGYIYEGDTAPEECPVCHVGAEKFEELKGEMTWADEHRIGVAKGVDEQVVEDLRANFTGECTEVGMYLAMSRQADREGYPEVAEAYKRIAFEEAEHAAKFAELLGECVVADTKENLKVRVDAEYGATEGKLKLAKRAKELGLDAIHDTVHEMCKDEGLHGSRLIRRTCAAPLRSCQPEMRSTFPLTRCLSSSCTPNNPLVYKVFKVCLSKFWTGVLCWNAPVCRGCA